MIRRKLTWAERAFTRFVCAVSDELLTATPGVADISFQWCMCNEDKGGFMVMCGTRGCRYGKWFHGVCINMTEEDAELIDEYYCQR